MHQNFSYSTKKSEIGSKCAESLNGVMVHTSDWLCGSSKQLFRKRTCSKIHENYIETMEGWTNWGNDFWLSLEKYGKLCRAEKLCGYNVPTLFMKSIKEIFN